MNCAGHSTMWWKVYFMHGSMGKFLGCHPRNTSPYIHMYAILVESEIYCMSPDQHWQTMVISQEEVKLHHVTMYVRSHIQLVMQRVQRIDRILSLFMGLQCYFYRNFMGFNNKLTWIQITQHSRFCMICSYVDRKQQVLSKLDYPSVKWQDQMNGHAQESQNTEKGQRRPEQSWWCFQIERCQQCFEYGEASGCRNITMHQERVLPRKCNRRRLKC